MRIQSAERRLTIRLWAMALVVDVVVAAAVSYFIADPADFWMTTFWIWLGIQVVGIFFSLLGTLRILVARSMGGFKPARDSLLAAFESHKFPNPPHFTPSVDDYLADVIANESVELDTRFAAAMLLGGREGIRQTAGLIRSAMITGAHEQALQEFAARHPPQPSASHRRDA